MDLSHLATIGLFRPKGRAPLSPADLDYFKQHGVEEALAQIVSDLAAQKPADPYKFIADAVSKGSRPATAPAKGGAAAPVSKAAAPKAAAPKAAAPAAAPAPAAAGGSQEEIDAVGTQIRQLKEKLKAEGLSGTKVNAHPEVKALVEKLQALKAGGAAAPAPAPKTEAPAKDKKEKAPAKPAAAKPAAKAKEKPSALSKPSKGGGVDVKKAENVPLWYEQVIMKAELIEQYPVKGCFILRPWAYRIWECIQSWFDKEIKDLGVENCYFPMFIPRCYIEKEEDHLNDFAPELAWVSKFGNQEIDEPVAIRPTSETAMYAAYSNWVQSHRDLPIKLNQWCSVVRWEVKQTTPFLRTREFLWQEGHSAFDKKAEAEKEVLDILELYALVYEYLLAIPVVRGTKTKAETFPGADYTTTVEAFIPATGRAIQGATSHHLGQNFAKMFDISFQDPSDASGKTRANAYQNSWGITQRTIGVMTMVHGDDRGLVLPPRVACFQVVLVQVGIKKDTPEADVQQANTMIEQYYIMLKQAGLRVKLDDRDQSPGWKFNYWEMKGVPLRIELGPMDIKKGEFMMAKRNLPPGQDSKIKGRHSHVVEDVKQCLEDIHKEMYDKAIAEREERLVTVSEWKDFSPNLNKGKLLFVPFCGDKDCEEAIKDKSKEEAQEEEAEGGLKMGAKSLCVPLEDKWHKNCPTKCINPDCTFNQVTKRTLFGRSY